MRKIVAVILWAGTSFCWQPLWGQAPSVRVEEGKEPKHHSGGGAKATQESQHGTANRRALARVVARARDIGKHLSRAPSGP
jgi:hypothetical protein